METHKDGAHEHKDARSLETGVTLGVLGAGVGLSMRFLDAVTDAEMSLCLAHGRSSKKESVGAYHYNYILDI